MSAHHHFELMNQQDLRGGTRGVLENFHLLTEPQKRVVLAFHAGRGLRGLESWRLARLILTAPRLYATALCRSELIDLHGGKLPVAATEIQRRVFDKYAADMFTRQQLRVIGVFRSAKRPLSNKEAASLDEKEIVSDRSIGKHLQHVSKILAQAGFHPGFWKELKRSPLAVLPLHKLSKRQREAWGLVVEGGMPPKTAANKMGISKRTVDGHISIARKKLGLVGA